MSAVALGDALGFGPNNKVKAFHDVHRFILQRHADLEMLRSLHSRKIETHAANIAECRRGLEHDAVERTSQIDRLGEDVQQYTTKKFDELRREVADYHARQRIRGHFEAQVDKTKERFQIARLAQELHSIRSGLLGVAGTMEHMADSLDDSNVDHEEFGRKAAPCFHESAPSASHRTRRKDVVFASPGFPRSANC
mmetsp:Transcript_20156/g.55793  ORF Transcript_20156/g.55793 Transcript_20156/m.55793 type:complete len:195 (-) Transcript_20156:63-647(-)